MDTGCEIYEMIANPLPVEPQRPLPEHFESETQYRESEVLYETNLQEYRLHSQKIETMVEHGTAQLLVDVSNRKPQLCYRVVSETETQPPAEVDTVEKLRSQDKRNKEIAVEKGVEDVKRLVRENAIPNVELGQLEEGLIYYIMLSSLRKENLAKLGLGTQTRLTDEEKEGVIASLTDEQKNIIKRDFIIKHLTDTFGNRRQSHLLLEFATLHFPEKVKQIKELHNENYKKKHIRIEERIREIQPFTNTLAEEAAPVPETIETDEEKIVVPDTFEEPATEDIPLYPGLPEHARIGEIPEEEEELLGTVYDVAA
jgi:ParB family chromosome partitioning protein